MLSALRTVFGERLQENVILAPYTSARIGGPADALITVKSADELAETVARLWEMQVPYVILGGGSNVLVSDRGVRGVVVLNRAKDVRFDNGDQPKVWAEVGYGIQQSREPRRGIRSRRTRMGRDRPRYRRRRSLRQRGAFGGDMAGNLVYAELLTENGREQWPVEKMEYGYRTSVLKRSTLKFVILTAEMRLSHSTKEAVRFKIGEFVSRRKVHPTAGREHGFDVQKPAR